MTFSHSDYVFQGAGIPIIIVVLLFFIAFAIGRRIAYRQGGGLTSLFPLFAWFIIVLLGLQIYAEGMVYPLTAWIQAKYPVYITTGQISAIYDAPTPPVYYDESTHSFIPAKIIVVDNQPYYVLKTDTKEGDRVRIEWSTDERIVYDIKKIDPGDDCVEPPVVVLPNAGHEAQLNPDVVAAGEIIRNVSFFLWIGIIGLQYPIGRKMAQYFQEKDRLVTGRVVPNRYGVIWYGAFFAPVFGVLVGFVMTGAQGMGIIAVMGGIGLCIVTLIKQTTTLEVQHDILHYKVLNTIHMIDVKEIISIEWGRSQVPFNRRLIIKLNVGRCIILDQEHHWGLENMYTQLQKLRDSLHEC